MSSCFVSILYKDSILHLYSFRIPNQAALEIPDEPLLGRLRVPERGSALAQSEHIYKMLVHHEGS